MRLVDELGFDGVDAGGLDESWRQQPGHAGLRHRLRRRGRAAGAGRGEPGRKPEWRATADRPVPVKPA